MNVVRLLFLMFFVCFMIGCGGNFSFGDGLENWKLFSNVDILDSKSSQIYDISVEDVFINMEDGMGLVLDTYMVLLLKGGFFFEELFF